MIHVEHRCRTCKHWEVPVESIYPGVFRPCLLTTGIDDEPESDETLAYSVPAVDDTDCHFAYLLTHPNFGCVQWEAKE